VNCRTRKAKGWFLHTEKDKAMKLENGKGQQMKPSLRVQQTFISAFVLQGSSWSAASWRTLQLDLVDRIRIKN
jgi:hypothetical protein